MAGIVGIKPPDPVKLVAADRVHASVYTDPEIFALELERIFARAWNYVGHESQVPAPGDYIATHIAQRPVLMVRGRDREVRVLRNRCAHRGARVVAERSGNATRLTCPYHGWSYDLEGRLVGLPRRDGYVGTAGPEPSREMDGDFRLERVETECYRGFVFARLCVGGPGLQEFLGGAQAALDNMVDRAPEGALEVAGGCFRAVQNNNWKIYLENLHDGIHPPSVHASSVASSRALIEQCERAGRPAPFAAGIIAANGVGFERMGELEVNTYPLGHSDMRGFRQPVDDSDELSPYRDRLIEQHGAEWVAGVLGTNIHNVCIYPSASAHPGFMQVRGLHPLGVDRTLIEIWTLRMKGAPEAMHRRNVIFANTVHSPASIIKADDLAVYRRVQDGLAGEADAWIGHQRRCPGHSALGEHYIRNQYRAWCDYMG